MNTFTKRAGIIGSAGAAVAALAVAGIAMPATAATDDRGIDSVSADTTTFNFLDYLENNIPIGVGEGVLAGGILNGGLVNGPLVGDIGSDRRLYESALTEWVSKEESGYSPDRMDAGVWALTALLYPESMKNGMPGSGVLHNPNQMRTLGLGRRIR